MALTRLPSYAALQDAQKRLVQTPLLQLFSDDANRADRYTKEAAGVTVDFSKLHVDDDVLAQLLALAEERGVMNRAAQLFRGEKINETENRAVLHPALRGSGSRPFSVDGVDVLPDVHGVLARMAEFAEAVRSGAYVAASGEEITDIVLIGIGGSHLGPQMVVQALEAFHHPRLRFQFVSNIDGHELSGVLRSIHPARTLFIVASKTFTTAETMANAHAARNWLVQHVGEAAVAKQFVALSTATDLVAQFGVSEALTFPFWDWVGGRYSVWSAIGLPVMIAVGAEGFQEFLRGAEALDDHFISTPPADNVPLLLGLFTVWYTTFWGVTSEAIIPYDARLRDLPAYLQQLVMESNGKQALLDGSLTEVPTSGVVWGAPGTDAQHSFFQLLHQGTGLIPVEFIGVLQPDHDLSEQHTALLANMVAQAEALLHGRSAEETIAYVRERGLPEHLVPAMTFPGNKPSTVLLIDRLTPRTLGALVALYEHRTLVAGTLWGINSFDQMGVELGKQLAGTIAHELNTGHIGVHDGSTTALISRIINRKI